jgi:polyisoprenoid-binding protein YceI
MRMRGGTKTAQAHSRCVGLAVLVLLAAILGPYVYIHFIEGPAPAKLELPKASPTTTPSSSPGPATSTASSSVDGNWNVGAGSIAGYRVREVLLGQSATAVGRTNKVWGSLTIDGSTVTKGTFTVDMASVVSDQSERNARFDGPIMDVSQYPTATLTVSSSIELGTIPGIGAVRHYNAVADVTMHGVTKALSIRVSPERLEAEVDVLADVSIPFSEWNIANPSIGGFVSTANNGTLEALIHLTHGPGNPASTSSGSTGTAGGGGRVTVPSTTVPPLTVPDGLAGGIRPPVGAVKVPSVGTRHPPSRTHPGCASNHRAVRALAR